MKKNLIIGIMMFTIISVSSTLGMKANNDANPAQVEQTDAASTWYSLYVYADWSPENMDEDGYYKFEVYGSYDNDFIEIIETTYCQTRPSVQGSIVTEDGVLYLKPKYGGLLSDYLILYSGYMPIAEIRVITR
ncbi:MAG: hypothetical protein LIO93_11645 [Bacteroidales bacterium]|nr:hypothetical protein [Bacteroidales bacterium]